MGNVLLKIVFFEKALCKEVSYIRNNIPTFTQIKKMENTTQNILRQNIEKLVVLTDTEWELLEKVFEKQFVENKQVLIQPGDKVEGLYFVETGMLRNYIVDIHGVERTLLFAPSDWWITDMYGFCSHQPAITYVEVIEPANVYYAKWERIEQMFEEIPVFERFFRILTQKSLAANHRRILDIFSLTAEERYEAFVNKYKKYHHLIPQKQIASYIGVTPEFFSKMKRKLLKGE